MQTLPIITFILFIIGILIYTFTLLLIRGNLFPLYSNNNYPYEEYVQFWKKMTSEQRLVLSQTYYQFFIYFKQKIIQIAQNKTNPNIEIENSFSDSEFRGEYNKYSYLPFVRVSLIPKSKNFTKRLLVCSHFDGHNLTGGGTAYDDAIHVVSMLGTIDALSKNDFKINTQVDFLFDGGEEYGLLGAYQYVDNLTEKIDYDYLNLEAMGGGPPYGFVIKSNNGSYRIQKALSKSRGSILMSSNYIYATKFTSSYTDHIVFDEQGWRGGVSVFLGKGSVYHTKYDRIEDGNEYHLKIAGNQLLDFVLNYESEGYNEDGVGYGIAPICVVFPILVMNILEPIIFICSILVIILKEKKNIKDFLKDLLKEFICFIIIAAIFLLEGLLVYLTNSNSPAANQVFLGLSAISGLFLFLIFQKIFKIKKWSRFRLIIDSLIMIISITTDLSLPFSSLTILSIIFYAFDNKIVKFIIGIFQVLVMSLFFAFLIDIFMQYTVRFNELIGNIVLFAIFFIFSYHITLSPLEFNNIEEEIKFLELIHIIFKKKNRDDKKEYLNSNSDSKCNINDEINNNIDNKSNSFKFFDKKYIPFYLMIIYILYPIILLLIFFLKAYPYSKEYTVRGSFYNIFKENETSSSMVFLPSIGYNYAKKYIEESEFKNNFREIQNISEIINFMSSNKGFVVESHDQTIGIFNEKCKNILRPTREVFNITYLGNTSNETYNFKFYFNISNNSCIDSVYIYISCNECVKSVNGIKINEKRNIHQMTLKVGRKNFTYDNLPDFIIESNYTLNIDNFNYTIFFNSMEITYEYYKFLDSFGEASCNSKGQSATDTIFIYDGSFSLKD